jgi:hypothetical protein
VHKFRYYNCNTDLLDGHLPSGSQQFVNESNKCFLEQRPVKAT